MSTRDNRDTHELLVQVCNAQACNSGRKKCPVPDACHVPIESVESAHPWLWLSYVCAFVAVIAGSAVFQW
jgi:hypothetical protein